MIALKVFVTAVLFCFAFMVLAATSSMFTRREQVAQVGMAASGAVMAGALLYFIWGLP